MRIRSRYFRVGNVGFHRTGSLPALHTQCACGVLVMNMWCALGLGGSTLPVRGGFMKALWVTVCVHGHVIVCRYSINNLGDPFVASNYGVHSRQFEVAVVDFFASLWGADKDSYWGYVTSCGTEGTDLLSVFVCAYVRGCV